MKINKFIVKRFSGYIAGAIMVTMLLLFSTKVTAAEPKKSVDVMFLHDVHSHISEFTTIVDNESKSVGGFARIKSLIDEQRVQNPDTLLLDAGDFSMGTLTQVLFESEASELRMLGHLGIEATTIGNHEFDYNADGLANMLKAAVDSNEELPELLVCNIDWEGMEAEGLNEEQALIKDAFEQYGAKDYTVIQKGGVRIAVIGVFGKDALDCAPNCPIKFVEPVDAVKRVVDEIVATDAADMLVCISHSGTWENESKSEDEILAKSVPELDLIISGHTHTKLDEPIVHGDTYIVSAAEYGKYLGSLSMSEVNEGTWKMDSYELIPIDNSIVPDEDTEAKIAGFTAMVDEVYLEQFGYTSKQVLTTNDIEFTTSADAGDYHTEQNLGSIMADAYTYAVETFSDDKAPVDVAVVPSGTIRDTYALGDVIVENVFNSFSLGIGKDDLTGYPLISVYLTGEELKVVAEIDASVSDLMTTARLYTNGMHWQFNPNRMILNKVTDVYLTNNEEKRIEIEDDKLYRVVTDYYSSQMLGSVTDMSYGLLSIIPKNADGTPITDYSDAIVTTGGRELKAWVAIAEYMKSFEDTDGDGISNVPVRYGMSEGRKVVEDSKDILELLKKPNKFFFIIIGVAVAALGVVIVIVWLVINLIKKIIKNICKRV